MVRGTQGRKLAPADGPVIGWHVCGKCGIRQGYDMFFHRGIVLCGDCRFEERSGRPPDRPVSRNSSAMPEEDYDNAPDWCMSLQCRMDADSEKHAAFLSDWIRESQLSID